MPPTWRAARARTTPAKPSKASRRWRVSRQGRAAGWTQGSGEESRSRFRRRAGGRRGHHHRRGSRRRIRRRQLRRLARRITLGLLRQVVQMVVFHRAVMPRCLATVMDDGMLKPWCRLREEARRLDGAETGPEKNEGEEEGNDPFEHGPIVASLSGRPPRVRSAARLRLRHWKSSRGGARSQQRLLGATAARNCLRPRDRMQRRSGTVSRPYLRTLRRRPH